MVGVLPQANPWAGQRGHRGGCQKAEKQSRGRRPPICPGEDEWGRCVPSHFGTSGTRAGKRVGSQAKGGCSHLHVGGWGSLAHLHGEGAQEPGEGWPGALAGGDGVA